MIYAGDSRSTYSPYDVCRSTAQLHSLMEDKHNHFTVVRVTEIVLKNLTTQDYEDLFNTGIILWRVK